METNVCCIVFHIISSFVKYTHTYRGHYGPCKSKASFTGERKTQRKKSSAERRQNVIGNFKKLILQKGYKSLWANHNQISHLVDLIL